MSDNSDSEGPSPSKRKNYGLKFKLDAVKYAEKHNKSKAAKDLKVNRQDIQKWTNQKAQIEAQLGTTRSGSKTPVKRLQGAGRKLKDGEFDEKLITWIRQQRQKKQRVSRTTIQTKALALSTDDNFKVNNFACLLSNFVFRPATDGWKVSCLVTLGLSSSNYCLSEGACGIRG
jgi:hypothetical protein